MISIICSVKQQTYLFQPTKYLEFKLLIGRAISHAKNKDVGNGAITPLFNHNVKKLLVCPHERMKQKCLYSINLKTSPNKIDSYIFSCRPKLHS